MLSAINPKQHKKKKRGRFLLSGRGRNNFDAAGRKARQDEILDEFRRSNGCDRDLRQFVLGFTPNNSYLPLDSENPILAHADFIDGGGFICGLKGDGKSAMAGLLKHQLAQQSRLAIKYGGKPCSIVDLDLKPTTAPFWIGKQAAEQPDPIYGTDPLPVKVFDISPDKPTNLFNPMLWDGYQTLTLNQKSDYHSAALGFDIGWVYGEAFFSDTNTFAVGEFVGHSEPKSFHELAPFSRMTFKKLAAKFSIDESQFKDMKHAMLLMGMLAKYPAVLPCPERPLGVSKKVFDNAIDMSDVVKNPQFVSFRMSLGESGRASVNFAAYVITQTLYAAMRTPKKDLIDTYFFIDESQNLSGLNQLEKWIAAGREYRIHFVFLFHNMSQWEPTQRHTLLGSQFAVFFGVTDEVTRAALEEFTGTKLEKRKTVSTAHGSTFNQMKAETTTSITESVSYSEVQVPAISPNTVRKVTHHKHLGIMCFNQKTSSSYTQHGGKAFVFKRTYATSEKEFAELGNKEMQLAPGMFIPSKHPQLIAAANAERKTQIRTKQPSNGKPKSEAKKKQLTAQEVGARLHREQLKNAQV